MNIWVGSGKIVRANLFNSGRKILKFTLAITQNNSKHGRERTDYVPCIVYEPVKEIQTLLSEEQEVELQGSVRTFSFEVAGEKIYKTEIVVYQGSLRALK